MKSRSRQRVCRCGSGCKVSSSADGRTRWTCTRCDTSWTEGRKPGMGYKDWPGREGERKKKEGQQ